MPVTIMRRSGALAAAVLATGVITSGCARSAEAPSAATSSPSGATVDLPSLLPTPVNAAATKGPDSLSDNGIHMYFQVNGVPGDVMSAYKSALEGKGWKVTTIASSGGEGGGGATYTAAHGDAFAVVDGGGYQKSTYLDVCAWAAKPEEPNCKRGSGR